MTRMLIVLCMLLTMISLSSAQDEEPTAITLSCDGTTKVYVKSQESINPVTKMDVVVNVAERTVSFDGRVAHIDQIDARTIYFGGKSAKDTTGFIDGKTGVMTALRRFHGPHPPLGRAVNHANLLNPHFLARMDRLRGGVGLSRNRCHVVKAVTKKPL
ncbi:MAG: hypothetical protein WAK55_31985 [Xanthobacteraceae bacterium]